jgi:hypothetical protein
LQLPYRKRLQHTRRWSHVVGSSLQRQPQVQQGVSQIPLGPQPQLPQVLLQSM